MHSHKPQSVWILSSTQIWRCQKPLVDVHLKVPQSESIRLIKYCSHVSRDHTLQCPTALQPTPSASAAMLRPSLHTPLPLSTERCSLRKFSDLRHLFTIDIDLRSFNVLAQIESLGQLRDQSWHFTTKKKGWQVHRPQICCCWFGWAWPFVGRWCENLSPANLTWNRWPGPGVPGSPGSRRAPACPGDVDESHSKTHPIGRDRLVQGPGEVAVSQWGTWWRKRTPKWHQMDSAWPWFRSPMGPMPRWQVTHMAGSLDPWLGPSFCVVQLERILQACHHRPNHRHAFWKWDLQ